MGIDVWSDAIPQNNLKKILEICDGRMAIKGGLDCPALDSDDIPEEKVIEAVHELIDTYCPYGHFFPALTNAALYNSPRNDKIVKAELLKYGREWAQAHPIA